MSKQKREALQKLDETGSPFVESKTQQIFKNVANLSLRGNTYDAKHLDQFLGSGYGEKSFNPERQDSFSKSQTLAHYDNQTSDFEASVAKNRSVYSHLPSYLINSQAIKPSVSFLNLTRDKMVFNQYVDLQDGPSGIQKRPNIPTSFERSNSNSIFESERVNHLQSSPDKIGLLNSARSKLYDPIA